LSLVTGACRKMDAYDDTQAQDNNGADNITTLQRNAEAGNAQAQYTLGYHYYNTRGEDRKEAQAKAVEWFTKAAEQGYAPAQEALGTYYNHGDGGDLEKAVEWYKKAAEQGDVSAMHNLGYCYYHQAVQEDVANLTTKYYQAAFACFKKLAEYEDEDDDFFSFNGKYMVAHFYQDGKGVEKDSAEALRWYEKVIAQKGVDWLAVDARKQINSIRKEAEIPGLLKKTETGDAAAQCELGACYENGEGVEEDVEKAVGLYTKAAAQGHAQAQCNLGLCYEEGKGIGKDIAMAVALYKKAAGQGNAQAQCNLGFCYDIGQGVDKDVATAAGLYQKAAEQGVALAQYYLGVCYAKGEGVVQDTAKAAEWYRKAAEQGDEQAQLDLAACYENGEGVPQNISEAIKWYQKAAKQYNEIAQSWLRVYDY